MFHRKFLLGFLELANTSELPQYLFATKWGRDFLCRTGSITSLCHSLQELNPRPLDLKDHLYSVKGQADDLWDKATSNERTHCVISIYQATSLHCIGLTTFNLGKSVQAGEGSWEKVFCAFCNLKPGIQNTSRKAPSGLCLLPFCFSASVFPPAQ